MKRPSLWTDAVGSAADSVSSSIPAFGVAECAGAVGVGGNTAVQYVPTRIAPTA